MTWEIFLGIAALVSFVIAIGKIVANNTKAMTEIKDSLDELKEALGEQKVEVKDIKNDVINHETRITILEKRNKGDR